MRELSRGGTLVAANISALHSRTASEDKSRTPTEQPSCSPRRYDLSPPENKRTSLYSDRPLSTASETTERYSPSIQSSEEPPPHESGDSDSNEEDTVKCPVWTEAARASLKESTDSASSSSSSEQDDSDGREFEHRGDICDADYRTLTPSRRLDTSTRRDDDFKWMPRDDITAEPLSMELRVDECSASLDRRKRVSKERADRDRKTRSSASGKPPQHPVSGGSVRQSPRPRRPRLEEPPLELQRRWNSYEHFRWPPEGGWWPPMCWCHGPPMPPPPPPSCCMHDHGWSSHPSLPPTPTRTYKNEGDDRVRRLEADKDSLQLQVQVLSEQISAQNDKMSDLERALHDARQRLDDAEQRLQKEMLQRSSLETQKLELLSKLSEMRLRVAERGVLERSPPPPEILSITRPAPPRTPPANYGRQIERNNHLYSSLPRSGMASPESRLAFGKHNNMVVAKGRGHSVPNLAEKEEVQARGSPSPSLREVRARLGSGGSPRIEGGELARGPLRATAQPRLQRDRPAVMPWQTTDIKQWDCETTCGWLEYLGLETYIPAARTWLQSTPDVRGVMAAASAQVIEKELAIKHPMHRKKIVLAVQDLLGGEGDPYLSLAGALDTPWVLRWLEDVGLCGARALAAAAALDGRALHRLTHHDLYSHLKLHQALHALSIRRGIQVLRENNFSPDTMIRRALSGAVTNGDGVPSTEIGRWSIHRVMQWLNEIDLAEYAPNLRGSGVHGGLMLLESRFTAELLAALLNIPANKTLLRRHLTQRFNDLLGRDVIQQKRNAEQTLGYQPLTATTKYKVPKKSQFTLKRKKSKDEADFTDLVCPLTEDCSGDLCTTPTMKVKGASVAASAVCHQRDITEIVY